ncbi:hypothetical protein FT663_01815 [Candidozyma haemuli var. vulneris]|uniref:Septin-type G domain-containing protein n=1 Tax=Candidozyma haemuli TaxID=45357 RepID=A0A2V1AZM6_9ASCO|nr:hypothetical protein CXQ85_002846 [[Candida] haemuloni]KAF3991063.1 hypothetical protein FT662_01891 [[Candida] haemuloni var. vulneris]KAF3993647.1 hypothetical protein FT663_01815 [[Candida] haemuloni var. vulneris]PVH23119.1 hypothetical protein CXQ85_002846 [[Candida] haemuloni]
MPVLSTPSKGDHTSRPFSDSNNPFISSSQASTPSRPVSKRLIPRPQEVVNSSKIGLACLPLERENMCRRKGAKFTMILAGCSGTGKSTFLNTLFGEPLDESKETTTSIFFDIRERKYQLIEGNFELELTTVDVPGFGGKMDNQYSWMPIVKYIDHYFRRYMLQEEQPDRRLHEDNRVHVCLYFIQPSNTTLSALDIESMKEIAKRVNLIPIVARSDTLNKDELTEFKKIINNTLAAYDIGVCKFVSDQEVLDKIHSVSPYAVVGSNAMFKNDQGQMVRARKYHWGMVEIENPDHCDFLSLREVLMSHHMLDLIQSTEAHYNVYRSWCLKERLERAAENTLNGELVLSEDYENGLASYVLYKKASPWNTIMSQDDIDAEDAQLNNEVRKSLDDLVRKSEQHFKEWKQTLVKDQAKCNEDLRNHHEQITKLKEEIRQLNAGETGSRNLDDQDTRSPLLKNEFLGE